MIPARASIVALCSLLIRWLATALAAKPDYIALGPIFPTTLKSMRFAPQGIPKITEWKKRIGDIPLVAIGGIKFEQSAEIFAAGADSIAASATSRRTSTPTRGCGNGSQNKPPPHDPPSQDHGMIL